MLISAQALLSIHYILGVEVELNFSKLKRPNLMKLNRKKL